MQRTSERADSHHQIGTLYLNKRNGQRNLVVLRVLVPAPTFKESALAAVLIKAKLSLPKERVQCCHPRRSEGSLFSGFTSKNANPCNHALTKLSVLNPAANRYKSRRPSMAFSIVISSAYSKSAPTGMPTPIRVTRTPRGLSSFDKYTAVASPSAVGLVAIMISSTPPTLSRSINDLMCSWSGPRPESGESDPPST